MADLQVRPVGGFLRAIAQTTRSHVTVCHFRGRKFKVKKEKSPKVENWAQKRTSNFRPKTLLCKILTYKRPLIVIAAPQKLYSNMASETPNM